MAVSGREPSLLKSGANGGFASLQENSYRSANDPLVAVRMSGRDA